jgi:hypothetical protein
MNAKTKVNFDVTPEDHNLIRMIVRRSLKLAKEADVTIDGVSLAMDITAVHCNGNPLTLRALLYAGDFDFSHDVFGIRRHIDRRTGKLMAGFLPRYSEKVEP